MSPSGSLMSVARRDRLTQCPRSPMRGRGTRPRPRRGRQSQCQRPRTQDRAVGRLRPPLTAPILGPGLILPRIRRRRRRRVLTPRQQMSSKQSLQIVWPRMRSTTRKGSARGSRGDSPEVSCSVDLCFHLDLENWELELELVEHHQHGPDVLALSAYVECKWARISESVNVHQEDIGG